MEEEGEKLYVWDTSAYICAWNEQYPPDLFPAFWKRLDEMVHAGRIISPEDVLRELGKQADDPHAWLKSRKKLIIQSYSSEVQLAAKAILKRFPHLTKHGRGAADPFVVALAHAEKATVVTKEKLGGETKPKIPDACKGFGVECFSVLDFIRREGWVFR